MTRIELAKHSGAFNNSKLKLHHGAIDQNEISSKLPLVIMKQLKQILWEMGINVVEESSMKLKATRLLKKKVVASRGRRPQTSSSTSQQIGVLADQFSHISTGPNVLSATGAAGSAGRSLGSTNGARLLPSYAKDPSAGLNSIWSGGELGDF
ncbi:hypothetical protein PCASD_17334 [Puccinia coronata f. sp. avenae]|uniref:Uncharacterized protein n=1 Tax=Puccinia coronata f. sp. avenae TaxID=200324 RepID=A0A2N5U6T5_9BASI|nr:hypothetical protein PCASD_17334 [Puccinia coronata f. sp. avenae]